MRGNQMGLVYTNSFDRDGLTKALNTSHRALDGYSVVNNQNEIQNLAKAYIHVLGLLNAQLALNQGLQNIPVVHIQRDEVMW